MDTRQWWTYLSHARNKVTFHYLIVRIVFPLTVFGQQIDRSDWKMINSSTFISTGRIWPSESKYSPSKVIDRIMILKTRSPERQSPFSKLLCPVMSLISIFFLSQSQLIQRSSQRNVNLKASLRISSQTHNYTVLPSFICSLFSDDQQLHRIRHHSSLV